MQVQAITKHIKTSPLKARNVIDLIRNKNAEDALDDLRFSDKKAAKIIFKTLSSAINSAKNKDMNIENTYIKIAKVDQGQAYRRQIRKSRGSAQPIKKRTSHITIILADDENKELIKNKKLKK